MRKGALLWAMILTFALSFIVTSQAYTAADYPRLKDGRQVVARDMKLFVVDSQGVEELAPPGRYRLETGGTLVVGQKGVIQKFDLSPMETQSLMRWTSVPSTQRTYPRIKTKERKKGAYQGKEHKFQSTLKDGRTVRIVGNRLKIRNKRGMMVRAKEGSYQLANGKVIETDRKGRVLWNGRPVDRVTAEGHIIYKGKKVTSLSLQPKEEAREKLKKILEKAKPKQQPPGGQAVKPAKEGAGKAVPKVQEKAGVPVVTKPAEQTEKVKEKTTTFPLEKRPAEGSKELEEKTNSALEGKPAEESKKVKEELKLPSIVNEKAKEAKPAAD